MTGYICEKHSVNQGISLSQAEFVLEVIRCLDSKSVFAENTESHRAMVRAKALQSKITELIITTNSGYEEAKRAVLSEWISSYMERCFKESMLVNQHRGIH